MLSAEHFMVGIHPGNIRSGYCDTTYSTPTYPERERESSVGSGAQISLHDFTFSPQNREENCSTLSINNTKAQE